MNDQLDPNSFPIDSVMGSIFKLHQLGEMSGEEFRVANASFVEKHPEKYPILVFPYPPEQAQSYVHRRMKGGEYEEAGAKALGTWLGVCTRLGIENDGNAELLRWAREILHAATWKTPKIDAALERVKPQDNFTPFLFEALQVQTKDSESWKKRK